MFEASGTRDVVGVDINQTIVDLQSKEKIGVAATLIHGWTSNPPEVYHQTSYTQSHVVTGMAKSVWRQQGYPDAIEGRMHTSRCQNCFST